MSELARIVEEAVEDVLPFMPHIYDAHAAARRAALAAVRRCMDECPAVTRLAIRSIFPEVGDPEARDA